MNIITEITTGSVDGGVDCGWKPSSSALCACGGDRRVMRMMIKADIKTRDADFKLAKE